MSIIEVLPLTPVEKLIVDLLERNETFVVTYDALMRRLYVEGREPKSNVLQVVIGRIRKKLREGHEAGIIEYAEIETIYGRGIRLLRTRPGVSILTAYR